MKRRLELVAYIDGHNVVVGEAMASEDGTIDGEIVDNAFLDLLSAPSSYSLMSLKND